MQGALEIEGGIKRKGRWSMEGREREVREPNFTNNNVLLHVHVSIGWFK